MDLRLIADDMTGALDASAPFATAQSPVRILLPGYVEQRSFHNKLAISTESRALNEAEARMRVTAAMDALRSGCTSDTLWFKKVDSVLRGHPLAETLEMAAVGRFAHCVFAPAFPEMGRVTRGGRHFFRNAGAGWKQTHHGDLHAAFRALMGCRDAELDLSIPDIETADQLRVTSHDWRKRASTLWVGSRGLAHALSGAGSMVPAPRLGLFILGTAHPVTRAQAKLLHSRVSSAPDLGAIVPSVSEPLLIDPVPYTRDGTETKAEIERALNRLQPPAEGTAILVTGGDSLTVVLEELKAEAVDCVGEIAMGLPLARIVGGRLSGTMMVTKSGGFGQSDLLLNLLK